MTLSLSALDAAAAEIQSLAPHYTGVYLYRLEGDQLVLRGFAGRPSPHTHIPVGQGICGSAVAQGSDIVVPDVSADDRYLACNAETRSEIVVLVWDDGHIVGQIDIDSDEVDPFDDDDVRRLQAEAARIAPLFAP